MFSSNSAFVYYNLSKLSNRFYKIIIIIIVIVVNSINLIQTEESM